jgi:hypothetical protein
MTKQLQKTTAAKALPEALERELDAIGAMEDKQELVKLYMRELGTTIESFLKLARIVRRLEELGYDLSDIRIAIHPWIRKLAYDQLRPQVIVRFLGKPRLFAKIAALAIPDQERLADGGTMKVMELNGDHRNCDPLDLLPEQISQVFGPEGLRTDAEQIAYLRKLEAKHARPPSPDIFVDRKHGGILVRIEGGAEKFIPVAELLRYASELSEIKTR